MHKITRAPVYGISGISCLNHMRLLTFFLLPLLLCCSAASGPQNVVPVTTASGEEPVPLKHTAGRVIHVYVALCDNRYQGIVPVPAAIGNGQDPARNLYWGASLGVKAWFGKQPQWKKVFTTTGTGPVLERVVFKHNTENTWLVADAYDGKEIKTCTENFLRACSGSRADSVAVGGTTVYCGASAKLLAYIGHNGLMDFSLSGSFPAADSAKRSAVILACISKNYFSPLLKQTGARPLLWTTGLMCPEAYTLDAAITSWQKNENAETTGLRAAQAYHKYQHCGVNAAKRLLVSGW